jgi:hypothetical protein
MKSTLRIGSCSGISSAVNVSHNQRTPFLKAPGFAAIGRTYLQHIIKHTSNATTQQVNLGPTSASHRLSRPAVLISPLIPKN